MGYILKPDQPAIEVTDGAYAGRKYTHGTIYAEVPPEEAHRFEQSGVDESGEAGGEQ